ncbi:MAG: pyridoxamine 5'-phosphate oxidase family protein [Bacillota bacterium]|jgi:flavin reductase (DIM6/NTAB) family NADH-FMN oxidoreductase RutF|uniref:pyridoxamine 5'-phosphate oxidase family protein n=1 Tax=Bacillus sp. RO2 TaxID=2723913 RepID=UPI00145EF5D9|nr:pyridoxamine 5'-phosphate oxidase family protein [Bacillus sp. RO2]MEA3321710.1 pyridoxamine 5'-phosphate oxidase family protein [Bacillota bacterium]NMH72616.1 pyridoxamine 5'-phosphate oxidase [Bacillus sp. RO2]
MPRKENALNKELVELLQGEKIVSLITTDKDSNKPNLSIVSWLVAHEDGKTIKFALGHKAESAFNIQENPELILGVVGAGSCYSINGKGSVSEVIDKTMKYRVVTVEVESVEDVIFYGGKITQEPDYVKTYDEDLAKKLDEEVYALLKG